MSAERIPADAEIIADTLRTFDLDPIHAAHVADLMSAAANPNVAAMLDDRPLPTVKD